jgi:hypothetical protein
MGKLGDEIMSEITADWARKTSKEVLSERVSEQLKKALKEIKAAVNNDRESAPLHGVAHEKTLQILRSRGFTCEKIKGFDQRDPDYVKITW